ncbi:MAG TPA: hypothetical protein VHG35_10830 [Gemmatimonadales bacterium]|nr:hypothetical protein [Gemmatimonadales bacterium]
MFPGSPARIVPTCPLRSLATITPLGVVLGVWLRGCARPMPVRCRTPGGVRHLLASEDLGYLLRRCALVALRDGGALRLVSSGVLVRWRVLEVVLGAPYLPPPAQLRGLFPRARVREGVLSLPLGLGSAEEALALCAAERVPVVATRIAYRPRPAERAAGHLPIPGAPPAERPSADARSRRAER